MAPKAEHPAIDSEIDQPVAVLFNLVTETLGWATSALLEQDFNGARNVIDGDQRIDEQCEAVVASVNERLSSATATGDDLENLVAILQIVPELERSADLAKHIAQRSLEGLGGFITPRARGLIQAMSEIAIGMWRLTGEAYVKRSRGVGFDLDESDNELDELCAALVTEGSAQGQDPKIAVDLALIARFYERLGDHAVNLARRIDSLAAPRRLTIRESALTTWRAGGTETGRGPVARLRRWFKGLRLMPHDQQFFEFFTAAAANARECAGELNKMTASFSDLDEHFQRIRELEHRGDELTVEVLRLLDLSFVTPFDREDIHALVEELDDVVDDMFSAASLIVLVHVDQPLPEVPDLAEILVKMADEMLALMECLRSKEGGRYRLERIEQLEHQGDAVFRRAMGRLFSGEYEALDVLKWKDIIQSVEDSLNAIEQVSDVVESILVKE